MSKDRIKTVAFQIDRTSYARLRLSAHAYHRIPKLVRIIADLVGAENIQLVIW